MASPLFCLHAHFFQPHRGNPFDDDRVGTEAGAEPYLNWNEKILAECYRPNAELGNLELISFDIAPSLLGWMQGAASGTYRRFLEADQKGFQRAQAGHAVAVPLHHTILPLASRRDKLTQVRWGLAWHRHHYGHDTIGMWLPEMAVDLETLEVFHAAGVQFTILSQWQVQDGHALSDAGPFWVTLPGGGRIGVYVRNDELSNQLSFMVSTLGGAGHWARNVLAPRRRMPGRLSLLVTDGETFGHHYPGEEHFLHWLMYYEALSAGFKPVILSQDFLAFPPQAEIQIHEGSSWNCPHGLLRWSSGCMCTPGDMNWKPTLRRAFEALAERVNAAYQATGEDAGVDPWTLRDSFVRVPLGAASWGDLLAEYGLARLNSEWASRLHKLSWAEYYLQRAFASATFHFDDPDCIETKNAIASAGRAVQLASGATGEDFTSEFRHDLEPVASPRSGRSGTELFDEVAALAHPPFVA